MKTGPALSQLSARLPFHGPQQDHGHLGLHPRGKFEVNCQKWEFCHFLDGYGIITPEGEQAMHLKAGDVFVIEPGMNGTWEVVETVRKYFVFA